MPVPFNASQQQLIRLIEKGYTDGEISRKMALSNDQLQHVLSEMCKKVKVASRLELILMIWSARAA